MTKRTPRPPIIYPTDTTEPHRTCTLCRYKLPAHHFHHNGRDGRQSICKKCRNVYSRDYRAWRRSHA